MSCPVAEGIPRPGQVGRWGRIGRGSGSPHSLTSDGSAAHFPSPLAALAVLVLALAALVSAPAAAQTVSISASGNCGGTPANCGTPDNRNGDRDTTWPGLQVNEGDTVTFSVSNDVGHPSYPNPGFSAANLSRSGTAFNSADLNTILLQPFTATTITAPWLGARLVRGSGFEMALEGERRARRARAHAPRADALVGAGAFVSWAIPHREAP